MRAASLATRTGVALQNSLVCTPQLRTAQNPIAITNGGSVRVSSAVHALRVMPR